VSRGAPEGAYDAGAATSARPPAALPRTQVTDALAATKFAPPRVPPGWVARPRLDAALERGLQAPLTLIAASPGAGKSALLGSWVAVFPDTLEPLFGVGYDFEEEWGVSRATYEALTLGSLAVILAVGIVGYVLGRPVREREADVPLEPVVETV